LEGFLEIFNTNIFNVFLFIFYKKLETWKSFVTSRPEAFVCNVLPPHSIGHGFTHNPAFLPVSELKMAGSAELVDLAETEGANSSPSFFFNTIGFLDIFRSFYGIFKR